VIRVLGDYDKLPDNLHPVLLLLHRLSCIVYM